MTCVGLKLECEMKRFKDVDPLHTWDLKSPLPPALCYTNSKITVANIYVFCERTIVLKLLTVTLVTLSKMNEWAPNVKKQIRTEYFRNSSPMNNKNLSFTYPCVIPNLHFFILWKKIFWRTAFVSWTWQQLNNIGLHWLSLYVQNVQNFQFRVNNPFKVVKLQSVIVSIK